ncbi:MAG: hypothetical protein JWP40_3095 [Blastococcus sp.]|nr:hypothetical protein [Blastococcus sp.]
MIAVTCRNGEHFFVDPASIERVETDSDTVIHLVDGRKYVVAETFDEFLLRIRDHRATELLARQKLYGGVAEIAEQRPTTMRIERRARSREAHSGSDSRVVHPDPDEV